MISVVGSHHVEATTSKQRANLPEGIKERPMHFQEERSATELRCGLAQATVTKFQKDIRTKSFDRTV